MGRPCRLLHILRARRLGSWSGSFWQDGSVPFMWGTSVPPIATVAALNIVLLLIVLRLGRRLGPLQLASYGSSGRNMRADGRIAKRLAGNKRIVHSLIEERPEVQRQWGMPCRSKSVRYSCIRSRDQHPFRILKNAWQTPTRRAVSDDQRQYSSQ